MIKSHVRLSVAFFSEVVDKLYALVLININMFELQVKKHLSNGEN